MTSEDARQDLTQVRLKFFFVLQSQRQQPFSAQPYLVSRYRFVKRTKLAFYLLKRAKLAALEA